MFFVARFFFVLSFVPFSTFYPLHFCFYVLFEITYYPWRLPGGTVYRRVDCSGNMFFVFKCFIASRLILSFFSLTCCFAFKNVPNLSDVTTWHGQHSKNAPLITLRGKDTTAVPEAVVLRVAALIARDSGLLGCRELTRRISREYSGAVRLSRAAAHISRLGDVRMSKFAVHIARLGPI